MRKDKQPTKPPVLAKKKEMKEDPIQKIQPRNRQNYQKTPKQQRRTIILKFADNKTGHHYINVPQKR